MHKKFSLKSRNNLLLLIIAMGFASFGVSIKPAEAQSEDFAQYYQAGYQLGYNEGYSAGYYGNPYSPRYNAADVCLVIQNFVCFYAYGYGDGYREGYSYWRR